ncbi:MAG: peptide chain release factor 3, partial [Methylococcales bacterium]
EVHLFSAQHGGKIAQAEIIKGLYNPKLDELLKDQAAELRDEIDLVKGASHEFLLEDYLSGNLTPVFFGSAINNFGILELLDALAEYAPSPQCRQAEQRLVNPQEEKFTGFVFKVQANMDPSHRDRVAFLRVCSGKFDKGMKVNHVRLGKNVHVANAITFQADTRKSVEEAFPGDIIGLHNHGTIQVGDTFTQGEVLKYGGIPYFAPELFRRVILKDPLRAKSLQKGLVQLTEEGATQLFKPLKNNDLILGAVGILQFDVTAFRLKGEYNVECVYDVVPISTVRWVSSNKPAKLEEFKNKAFENLAEDGGGYLVYLANSRVNLQLTEERWPDINFSSTREL